MFVVNDDLSIYATRGDIVCLNVSATDDSTGNAYEFQPGDIVRMKIFAKKDAENVVMQKDFPVVAKTDAVGVFLSEDDTKIGEVISKPTDYWYEIELNPYTNPQTFIGYDEDGAKIFKLFPEGKDIRTDEPTKPEDIPVVDVDLSLTSSRPVENKAISRAITLLKNDLTMVDERLTGKIKAIQKSNKEMVENAAIDRARMDNLVAHADVKLEQSLAYVEYITEETKAKIDAKINSDGVFATINVNWREANQIYGGTTMEMFLIPIECRPMGVGLIHTEDGLEYRINYDGARYYMSIRAQSTVTVAPTGAGSVTMTYALGSYELNDIRVGANGVRYNTAGDAVRAQIINLAKGYGLESGFLDNQVRSYNLNNLEAAKIGYYLSTDDEVITMSDRQAYTDYISVREGEKYVARHPWGAQWSVSFYDELKVLVAQQSYTEDTVVDTESTNDSINTVYWHCVTVPYGVAYMRLNVGTANLLDTMVVKCDTSAHIPSEYVAYAPDIHAEAFLRAVFNYVMGASGIINTEENTVLGVNALPISEGVRHNVAVGAEALANITVDTEVDNQSGRYNVAIGGKAMKATTTGNHNTACGFQAMLDNKTGTANTAVGEDALMTNSVGNNNVAVGCRALQSATEGDDNVAVGQGAGYWNDELHPNGSRNTMLGAHSGQTDGDGSNNVSIGYFAKATNGLNYTIAIGSGAVATKDRQTVIGSGMTKETVVRGDLIVMGADDTKRQIVFNKDGTCSWVVVE